MVLHDLAHGMHCIVEMLIDTRYDLHFDKSSTALLLCEKKERLALSVNSYDLTRYNNHAKAS